MSKTVALTFHPLSLQNWDKFVELFGDKGACGGCWCMYFRLSKVDFSAGKYNANKTRIKELVRSNRPTGILAFSEGRAAGWCALAPREHFARLERSRVHKRIDDKHVWSIPCFFIDRKYRNQGVSLALLKAAIKYAKANKIKILEAYPVAPTDGKLPDTFAYYGFCSTFEKVGFKIVDRTSKNRPMVRFEVK